MKLVAEALRGLLVVRIQNNWFSPMVRLTINLVAASYVAAVAKPGDDFVNSHEYANIVPWQWAKEKT